VFKLGVLFIAIGLLLGCTSSKEKALMQSYQQKVDYHKQLQMTEKIQLFEDHVTKIVITAAYLYRPTFDKKDARDEVFIIGLHLEDENDNPAEIIRGLTLDNKSALKTEKLAKNDSRLKDIAYKTEWAMYYQLTFEHTDKKQFSIMFNNSKYDKSAFSFSKVAKYVYTKKGF